MDIGWDFTKDSFREALVSSPSKLFPSFARKNWIKIYALLVNGDWKKNPLQR